MYQKELTSQQERVKKLEADLKNGDANEDGNAEFMVKQEVNTYRQPFPSRLASVVYHPPPISYCALPPRRLFPVAPKFLFSFLFLQSIRSC